MGGPHPVHAEECTCYMPSFSPRSLMRLSYQLPIGYYTHLTAANFPPCQGHSVAWRRHPHRSGDSRGSLGSVTALFEKSGLLNLVGYRILFV